MMNDGSLIPRYWRQTQRGFSMAELLVSVLIGMLALVFVMRTTISFETNRRSTIGGSDSMQNGVIALFSMENDAAQSGWGLNDALLMGCPALFYDSQNYANANVAGGVALTLAPVAVVFGGANPDQISFYSGTSESGTGSVGISAVAAAGSTVLNIDQVPWGFRAGDVLAIAPTTVGGNCAIAQVSAVVQAPTQIQIANDGTLTTRFNQAGGLLTGPFGIAQAKVFNLGQGNSLAFHTWDVNNGVLRLRSTDLNVSSNAPVSAVSGIVSIKALYGFDTRTGAAFTPDSGMNIGQWSAGMIDADADGVVGGPGDFQHLSAIRLAVVARSREAEKPDATGTCPSTTAVLPTVFASQQPAGIATVPIQVNVAVTGDTVDWTCYRYRTFETIVPLRNSGWKP